MNPRLPTALLLCLPVLPSALLATGPLPGATDDSVIARRQTITAIDDLLRAGRYKPALRRTRRETEDILGNRWYDPGLTNDLAALLFARALAEANLGRDREAIWSWHTALNLDPRLHRRDLTPYGKAAGLLREFPLRDAGTMPAGFDPWPIAVGTPTTAPHLPPIPIPTIVNNTAAVHARPGDAQVEVIVDQDGRLHHPVMRSTHLHPIIQIAVLELLRTLPRATPGRRDGHATDMLFQVTVALSESRW